ncbi:hypothetical protein DYB32_000619 [Aphanomyces invadans]|uniref:Uncharacterized protein n=1 Tax=Aphanomyces invadans TaxID=157072 RepID=A0A3R6YGE1_9STRA|nr:hypothetical protein DYB32_000619 [Aphanomyces invadans]
MNGDKRSRADYFKEYRRRNKAKIAAQQKKYRECNKDKIHEYKERNKDKVAAYHKEYRGKYRSRNLAQMKLYYERNKAYFKAYYIRHKHLHHSNTARPHDDVTQAPFDLHVAEPFGIKAEAAEASPMSIAFLLNP